jgi:dTDP-4-dehydrorhamnose 3,5-epimerase
MLFNETTLSGAYVIELEPNIDGRGFFARTFCKREFEKNGLPTHFPQNNLSRNRSMGTLRGMHYDALPSNECKLVRCLSGSIYDVIIDLRPGSPTRWRSFDVTLTAERGTALYIPAGFAHGFLTLADEVDVHYQMGDYYRPSSARGFRYDDPFFGIRWPREPLVISERDGSYADFDPSGFDDEHT